METTQETKNIITLRGSTDIVAEFFEYSINSILYQRGIYPPESFRRVPKYGLTMLVTTDEGLISYLKSVLAQLDAWLMRGEVRCLVLVVKGVDSGENLERWQFNVETTRDPGTGRTATQAQKSQKEITQEIQAIIRQITASVTFLPLLNEPCCFDLLIYTDASAEVPSSWEDSDPCYIDSSHEVRLRSFTTKIHKVDAMVSYRNIVDEI